MTILDVLPPNALEKKDRLRWRSPVNEFYIEWDQYNFTIVVNNTRDRNTAEIEITVPNSPALMDSFIREIDLWRKAALRTQSANELRGV